MENSANLSCSELSTRRNRKVTQPETSYLTMRQSSQSRPATSKAYLRPTLSSATLFTCHRTPATVRHCGAMIGKKMCPKACPTPKTSITMSLIISTITKFTQHPCLPTGLTVQFTSHIVYGPFADLTTGTGNYSSGNFNFDPRYYPSPERFIPNLTHWGYDFQVWAANRAFLNTELFNTSQANGWLFPGINPELFLGPALNLSIPEAYQYFKKRLSYFPSVGVKGYKIDRGEEDEMPGTSFRPTISRSLTKEFQSTNKTFNPHSSINYCMRLWSKSGAKATSITSLATP